MRVTVLAAVSLLLIVTVRPLPVRAAPPADNRSAIAERTPDGGSAWATFKRVDVAQELSSRAVFVARNN